MIFLFLFHFYYLFHPFFLYGPSRKKTYHFPMTTFKMLKTELCSFQGLFQPIANNYIMPAGSMLHPSLLTVTHVIIGSNTPNKKKCIRRQSRGSLKSNDKPVECLYCVVVTFAVPLKSMPFVKPLVFSCIIRQSRTKL